MPKPEQKILTVDEFIGWEALLRRLYHLPERVVIDAKGYRKALNDPLTRLIHIKIYLN